MTFAEVLRRKNGSAETLHIANLETVARICMKQAFQRVGMFFRLKIRPYFALYSTAFTQVLRPKNRNSFRNQTIKK